MKSKILLLKMGICAFVFFSATENATAQIRKNTSGYAVFTYEELKSKTSLRDLSPETNGIVASYTVTLACAGKDLQALSCTGDSLTKAFFIQSEKCRPKSCVCYFDKIISIAHNGSAIPLEGFVVEMLE